MTDHPDLEKIADPAIREVVREVFRNPENGAPDKISKVGCLALARNGQLVWNQWRLAFPCDSDEDLKSKRNPNRARFEGADLSGISFSGFQFGSYADFRNTKLGIAATFRDSYFGTQADFTGMTCDGVSFVNCRFYGTAIFQEMTVESWISFHQASFYGAAIFSGSHFRTVNLQATFLDRIEFIACQVDDTLDMSALGDINTFRKLNLSGSQIHNVLFCDRRFLGPTIFEKTRTTTRAARYRRRGNLLLEVFGEDIPPGVATSFTNVPNFHGAELHQDTTFDDARFPSPKGSDEAARAYRTLKLAFSKQQATSEEQRFFRLEMAEEALRAKGFNKWLFQKYQQYSDFGFSVTRPLKLMLLAMGLFAGAYGAFSWFTQCFQQEFCEPKWSAWLEFSVLQSFPLPGLDKASETLRPKFLPTDSLSSVLVTILVMLHKAVSLLALFLIGLALRNLFKLK